MGKTHDDDEVEIDLRELFYALKKHILIILAALLVGAVIAGAATKIFITPVYSATSTMLFWQRRQHFPHWQIFRLAAS